MWLLIHILISDQDSDMFGLTELWEYCTTDIWSACGRDSVVEIEIAAGVRAWMNNYTFNCTNQNDYMWLLIHILISDHDSDMFGLTELWEYCTTDIWFQRFFFILFYILAVIILVLTYLILWYPFLLWSVKWHCMIISACSQQGGRDTYRRLCNARPTKSQNSEFLVSSCSCLWPIHWSQVFSREWICSWSSTNRRCSNFIWVTNNFIAF